MNALQLATLLARRFGGRVVVASAGALLIFSLAVSPVLATAAQVDDDAVKGEFLTLAWAVRWNNEPNLEARLTAFRRRTRGTAWEQRATYLLGRIAFRRERFAESIALFARVARHYPILSDYAEYNIGRAFARQGLYEPALRHLLKVRQRFPDSRLQARVLLSLADSYVALGAQDRAVATFEHLTVAFPDSDQCARALDRLAAIYLQRGKIRAAAQRLARLYLAFPARGGDDRIRRRLDELTARLTPRPELLPVTALVERAKRLEARAAWRAAAAAWQRVVERADDESLKARSALNLAMALKRSSRASEAARSLETFLKQWPRHAVTPEATYRLAQLLWRPRTSRQARRLFSKLPQTFSTDPWAARALYALGQMAEAGRRDAQAQAYYRKLVRRFPEGPDRERAFWRIGWLHYRNHRYRAAAGVFNKQLAERPGGPWGAAAAYWLGRSYERLGKRKQAHQVYRSLIKDRPLSYYARTAMQRLTRHAHSGIAEQRFSAFRSNPPLQDSVLALINVPMPDTLSRRVRLARELALMQLPLDAQAEVKRLAELLDDRPAHRFLLGVLHYDAGATLKAFGIYQRVLEQLDETERKALPREFWKAYFPVTYRAEVAAAVRRWKLDELLVLSVIRQESAFDPDSRSTVGAIGLMQVLPQTGRALRRRKRDGLHPGNLFDPALNIKLGSEYLARLLRQFGNSLPFALAAYNAGPRAVKRWRVRFGKQPLEEFIENIPYRETRAYVKRVLRNYAIYQQLYQPNGKS